MVRVNVVIVKPKHATEEQCLTNFDHGSYFMFSAGLAISVHISQRHF